MSVVSDSALVDDRRPRPETRQREKQEKPEETGLRPSGAGGSGRRNRWPWPWGRRRRRRPSDDPTIRSSSSSVTAPTAIRRPGRRHPRPPGRTASDGARRSSCRRYSKVSAHVHLRCRHHLGLVMERPLTDGQPDGDEVLLLTAQPQIPAAEILLTVDGHHGPVLFQTGLGPPFDERLTAGPVRRDWRSRRRPGPLSLTLRHQRRVDISGKSTSAAGHQAFGRQLLVGRP